MDTIVLRCGEVPGQQFVDAADWMIGDPIQHLAHVEFRIEPVELGCPE
jgi:hypothetical protein